MSVETERAQNLPHTLARLKSQGVSPSGFFSQNQVPKSQIARGVPVRFFSENQVPKCQIARGVPVRFFSENHLPKSQIARGVPLGFFQRSKSPDLESQAVSPGIFSRMGCPRKILVAESPPQISNRKGCAPTVRFFRKSTPQISNRKGCPPKIFQRIKSPNLKWLGVSPLRFFSKNHLPNYRLGLSFFVISAGDGILLVISLPLDSG